MENKKSELDKKKNELDKKKNELFYIEPLVETAENRVEAFTLEVFIEYIKSLEESNKLDKEESYFKNKIYEFVKKKYEWIKKKYELVKKIDELVKKIDELVKKIDELVKAITNSVEKILPEEEKYNLKTQEFKNLRKDIDELVKAITNSVEKILKKLVKAITNSVEKTLTEEENKKSVEKINELVKKINELVKKILTEEENKKSVEKITELEEKILTEEENKKSVEKITELEEKKLEKEVDDNIYELNDKISELNDKISELKNVGGFIHSNKIGKLTNEREIKDNKIKKFNEFHENINKALQNIDKSKKSIDSIKKINHSYNFDTYYYFKIFLNNKIKENRYHYILTFDIEEKELINFIIENLKKSSQNLELTEKEISKLTEEEIEEKIPKFQNVFVTNSLKISKKKYSFTIGKKTIIKGINVSFKNLIKCDFKNKKFINPLLSDNNNNNSMISLEFIDENDDLNEPLITFCNRFDIEFNRMEQI